MRKLSNSEFIKRSTSIHDGRYSYEFSEYNGRNSMVKIVCPNHGVFFQKAGDHLSGKGCSSCSGNKIRDFTNFLIKATEVHGLKYIYDYYKLVSNKTKIKIVCPEHGSFEQSVKEHLSGKGCFKCGRFKSDRNRIKSTEHFINKSREKHGDRYEYTSTSYSGWAKRVVITCKIHGEFTQLARAHLSGKGCQECGCYGFNPLSSGFVYFLLSEETNCIKIGITNDLKTRLRSLKRSTPFPFVLIKTVSMKGEHCRQLENRYHTQYESANLTGFEGATEWLKYSKDLMNDIFNTD